MTTSILSPSVPDPLEAAVDYAKRGWSVFPLHTPTAGGTCSCGNPKCTSIGKHPRTRNGLKDATTDLATIREWWTSYPDANIGVVTGRASGFIALDVDPRHGGIESMRTLQAQHGKLPVTSIARTGGGGWHYLFKYPGYEIGNRTNILPGLDLRADGGYIAVSPSLHLSGKRYAWHPERHPFHVPLVNAPEWLLHGVQAVKRSSIEEWRELAQGVSEGGRNEATAKYYGRLLRHHLDPVESLRLLIAWNRTWNDPPLSDDEVIKTANSIAQREFARRGGVHRA